jgi:hypothetical protein
MSICRKFSSCNAPQCPLDKRSLKTPHYSGEPICVWLLEYSKEDTRDQLNSAIGGIRLEVIRDAYQTVFDSYGTIKNRLERAKLSPSRLTPRVAE